jgi:hypothetical protein
MAMRRMKQERTTTPARRASQLRSRAHSKHEKRIGRRDANWPDWYAAYMAAGQSGSKLPQ